jgi:hypothetical protein
MAVARDAQVAWESRSGSFLGNAAASEENDTHIHILLDIKVQKYQKINRIFRGGMKSKKARKF